MSPGQQLKKNKNYFPIEDEEEEDEERRGGGGRKS